MHDGHRHWIDLVNAQEGWTTDDSMLNLIPEEDRIFNSPEWPRLKALAFLANNASSLRLNYDRLESGQDLDLALINPVLEGTRLRIVDWRRKTGWRESHVTLTGASETPAALGVAPVLEGWNRGTAAIRFQVQRAVYHFAGYVDWRLRDPRFPGATPGLYRVLACASCGALTPSPTGTPRFCSESCATDTGRLT